MDDDLATWDGMPHWKKENKIPERYITYLDQSVESKLPSSSRFEAISPHGASFWTRTAKILTKVVDGTTASYFLKVAIGENGRGMMYGEFTSMTALHKTSPELTPIPIAWGTYQSEPDVHFFLASFLDMDTSQLCSIDTFPKLLVELHIKGKSPDGKFGFPIPTYQGRFLQDTTPCDTWEECFSRNIQMMFDHELASQGYDEEFAQLRESIMVKVIPRLLRPMELGDRRIIPRLVHGDLWMGNTGTELQSRTPRIFDACSLYAHNEYELAPWRHIGGDYNKAYVDAYIEFFPPSEPKEDFEDRLVLYFVRYILCASALNTGHLDYRNLARREMRKLFQKYPGGFEEWAYGYNADFN